MTSQAQAAEPLSGVHGLVCFGFPLHPDGKPSIDRARHLDAIQIPILLLQSTRDKLAEVALIRGVANGLDTGVMLLVTSEADHSFHVPARSGTTDAQVMEGLLDAAAS